ISFVAVIPGLYFRKHYFVVMFPALAFLSGIWVDFLMKWCGKKTNRVFAFIPPLIFLMCAVSSMYVEREYFFTGDPARLSEEIYGENPFAASIEVGEYIKANSKEGDQIFVFGSEPQIYFYSGRRSVSPLIFTYPLVENNAFAKELQGELINALEKNIPRYFVYVNVPFSWSAHPEYDRKIFSWVSQFLEKHFTLEGYVDLIGDGKTEFSWGEKNIVSPPKSENSILVFKKKEPEIGEVLSLDPLGTRKRTKY
ncbi:MAG: hypothetical protein ACE5FU_07175, partial [Nitrospinota bacterium]